MPSVAENNALWDGTYGWPSAGEEWSDLWGGSRAQWFDAIRPRIRRFLPTGTVLEIAPGYGRWTSYLAQECEQLVGVDVSSRCVAACRERFAGDGRLTFHQNDGSSLSMVPDRSVDLVFSFDSLVHVEADVLEAYLREFARVLKPTGVGFIHHSNAGAHRTYFRAAGRLPGPLRDPLWKRGVVDRPSMRALSVSAELVSRWTAAAGLVCTTQELVNWNTRRVIDCFTTFAAPDSPWTAAGQVIRNPGFMEEARVIRERALLWPGR